MYAIVQDTYGPPSVLRAAEAPAPALAPGRLLIEVRASVVSQGDRRLRAGDFPGISWLPGRLMMGLTGPRARVRGTMFAGRVAAVGQGVTGLAVGDDVFGSVDSGAYAELLVVAAGGPVAKMPVGLTYESAAALPYGAVTALRFLRDLGGLRPGQRVCVLGATGGVGVAAVQIARHLGAEVTAVCSARHHDLARELGATHVMDYASQDFRQGGPYDLIFDTVGATRFGACRAALTPTGRYLSLILTANLLLWTLLSRRVGGRRAIGGVAMGRQQDLIDLGALVSAGALRPVVHQVYPLAQVADAHARVEAGGVPGVVALTVGQAA